jgi:long-chain acyl-CoA synthetase
VSTAERNLYGLVQQHEGIALLYRDQRISYADLRGAAMALAGRLRRGGVREGDVVSVLLPNSPAFVVTYLACWHIGAVANPLNTRLSLAELGAVVRHARSRVLVTGDTFAPKARMVAEQAAVPHSAAGDGVEVDPSTADGDGLAAQTRQVEILKLASENQVTTGNPRLGRPECPGGDRPAVLIYTSGTTSVPKGVLLSHDNMLADAAGIADRLAADASYRTVCFMPLFHCNALIFSHLSTFLVGGSVVLLPRFSASGLFDDVAGSDAHSFSCPPTVLAMLLERTPADRPAPPSLRFVKVGAAPLSPALAEAFESRFGVPLIEGYGMTEGTATTVMHDPRLPRPPGTVGRCLPAQDIRIVDSVGAAQPPCAIGEIQISGATIMLGYHRDPELTEATVVDGWLRTGDLGSLGEDGYLRLAGRKKELIIRGGENIFPAALDEVLQAHPEVAEAAVYGVPDGIWGESPAAAIVAKDGLDLDELRAFMAARVADFEMPVQFRLVAEVPRNAVGKVQRHELARRHDDPPNAGRTGSTSATA